MDFKDLKKGVYFHWAQKALLILRINSEDNILISHIQYPTISFEYVKFSDITRYFKKSTYDLKRNPDRKSRLKFIKQVFESKVYDHR